MLTVTHDIKAPVGSIMGYTELLVPHVRENRPKNYLDNIRSSSEHLLSLVGSLLDYHKLEAHKMDLHPVSFNPDELLHTIAQSFLPMAEKKGLELQCETSPETRRTYTGDAFRIRQIVDNLLSNALKFTQQGHILLRAKMHGRQLCITVRDTGCGMTAEEQQMIFKEFTRLSSAQGEEGVGLGIIHHAETGTAPSRRNPFGKYSRKRQFFPYHASPYNPHRTIRILRRTFLCPLNLRSVLSIYC